MTKSVHFSSTNIMYSPLPWSPSPGASTSSLPPSSSITTHPRPQESLEDTAVAEPIRQEPSPKPLLHRSTPILYSLWPSTPPFRLSQQRDYTQIQIHSLLSFMPFTPPNVHYDFAQPLHTINPQLTPSWLNPATYPPLPVLSVICRHIAWPMTVAPSLPTGFVSVLDVFTSVYTSLRLAVQWAEYNALPSADARRSVDDAYFARCRLVEDKDERGIEKLKGIKRVDFLLGRTRFSGLSGPLEAEHVWELNVS
ncbi:hypothetical protein C8F04DRAFT_1133849 [Mycena alexandri]|uniref:DUF6699 domain-containing protein n=1 Tax=Mycena alexandri TaxID=1745969 RepID=A0AAD6S9E6_9AGAR|nr:hypothetical protein C8F04DRAFT_1133849 [Mycena alexandri]